MLIISGVGDRARKQDASGQRALARSTVFQALIEAASVNRHWSPEALSVVNQ